MKTIAFIGIGVMGNSMAQNLLNEGYSVYIYSRTKSKANSLVSNGAVWCDTIKECVKNKDVVITIVGYPKDVEQVYFGDDGIIANAKEKAYLIDMTTTSPKLSQKIYAEAQKRNIATLDAPVSGGDIGARDATLSIMVGGDKCAFEECQDVLSCLGSNIIYEGRAGSGQHTKMANQIAIAGAIAGVCEAITYAKNAGLDPQTMINSISAGAAGSWQLNNMAPRILKGDFNPGFFIKHNIKDLNIAVDEAAERNLSLTVLNDVLKMYKKLEGESLGDLGTQALIKYYDK